MAGFPDEEWCQQVHERLLAGEPTASAELCKVLLAPLTGWLIKKGRTQDREAVHDAATDALVAYLRRPERWKEQKATLVSYLCMAADRDLLNLLEKRRRVSERELHVEDVELIEDGRNDEQTPHSIVPDRVLDALVKEVGSPTDMALIGLLIKGERSTDVFARELGIEHLSQMDKAREVKRHKDRLKKVLQRLGEKLHDNRK
jgi:RNA polymerase sigma-70 factor (ECF subfamily)